MQKFTIFTIIFSVAITLVMAELIINDYLESKNPPANSAQTTVLNTQVFEDKNDESNLNPKEKKSVSKFHLTEEILKNAGFEELNLKTPPFSGKLFQMIELAGIDNESVAKLNIFQGQEYTATVYEIPMDDLSGASELYEFIKEDAKNKPQIAVNETNSFLEGSFYINNSKKSKIAFLISKKANNIFAFEYAHRFHPLIKQTISLLANLKSLE